jgi:hypothetical protein
MDSDARQSVQLLRQGNLVLVFLESVGEFLDELRRDKRANLLEAVVALFGQLQEIVGGHPFLSRQGELNAKKAEELPILNC